VPERAVLGQARMVCSSAFLVHIKMVSSRTPIEKKGARRQKGGPSDCGPVVGLREEPDREGEAQEPNSAGTPRTTARRRRRKDTRRQTTDGRDGETDRQADGQAGAQAGRGTSRQADRQAGRQAGKQASRQAGKQAGRHPPTDYQTVPVQALSSRAGSELNPHLGVSRTKNCGNDKQAGRHTHTQASTQSRTSR